MHVVVGLGITNVGKSTVLSALGDRIDLFESGDVPGVTTGVVEANVGAMLLVDTPGLDVDARQANAALDRARRSDTVLFCHSLRMGELRPTELEALGLHLRNRERQRTCFVLTHADDVADEVVIRNVSQVISLQLEETFGLRYRPVGTIDPPTDAGERARRPFNVVGVPRYWRARRMAGRARARLAEESGIPRLRRFLVDLAERQVGAATVVASSRKR